MLLLDLFASFLQIGLFSIGGGYAAIPLIQNQVVTIHGWLTLEEFTDIITIAEMTPGPIAINCATFVGTRIAGLPGAIIATVGCILPALIIVLLLAYLYYKFKNLTVVQGILGALRPAVVAMIASAGLSILLLSLFGEHLKTTAESLNVVAAVSFVVCLWVLRKYKANPILVMLGSGLVGMILELTILPL